MLNWPICRCGALIGLLTAAQRALHQLTQAWDGDLAWLVEEEKSLRLLLFRQGFLRLTMHLRTSTLWPASARFGPVLLPGRPVLGHAISTGMVVVGAERTG